MSNSIDTRSLKSGVRSLRNKSTESYSSGRSHSTQETDKVIEGIKSVNIKRMLSIGSMDDESHSIISEASSISKLKTPKSPKCTSPFARDNGSEKLPLSVVEPDLPRSDLKLRKDLVENIDIHDGLNIKHILDSSQFEPEPQKSIEDLMQTDLYQSIGSPTKSQKVPVIVSPMTKRYNAMKRAATPKALTLPESLIFELSTHKLVMDDSLPISRPASPSYPRQMISLVPAAGKVPAKKLNSRLKGQKELVVKEKKNFMFRKRKPSEEEAATMTPPADAENPDGFGDTGDVGGEGQGSDTGKGTDNAPVDKSDAKKALESAEEPVPKTAEQKEQKEGSPELIIPPYEMPKYKLEDSNTRLGSSHFRLGSSGIDAINRTRSTDERAATVKNRVRQIVEAENKLLERLQMQAKLQAEQDENPTQIMRMKTNDSNTGRGGTTSRPSKSRHEKVTNPNPPVPTTADLNRRDSVERASGTSSVLSTSRADPEKDVSTFSYMPLNIPSPDLAERWFADDDGDPEIDMGERKSWKPIIHLWDFIEMDDGGTYSYRREHSQTSVGTGANKTHRESSDFVSVREDRTTSSDTLNESKNTSRNQSRKVSEDEDQLGFVPGKFKKQLSRSHVGSLGPPPTSLTVAPISPPPPDVMSNSVLSAAKRLGLTTISERGASRSSSPRRRPLSPHRHVGLTTVDPLDPLAKTTDREVVVTAISGRVEADSGMVGAGPALGTLPLKSADGPLCSARSAKRSLDSQASMASNMSDDIGRAFSAEYMTSLYKNISLGSPPKEIPPTLCRQYAQDEMRLATPGNAGFFAKPAFGRHLNKAKSRYVAIRKYAPDLEPKKPKSPLLSPMYPSSRPLSPASRQKSREEKRKAKEEGVGPPSPHDHSRLSSPLRISPGVSAPSSPARSEFNDDISEASQTARTNTASSRPLSPVSAVYEDGALEDMYRQASLMDGPNGPTENLLPTTAPVMGYESVELEDPTLGTLWVKDFYNINYGLLEEVEPSLTPAQKAKAFDEACKKRIKEREIHELRFLVEKNKEKGISSKATVKKYKKKKKHLERLKFGPPPLLQISGGGTETMAHASVPLSAIPATGILKTLSLDKGLVPAENIFTSNPGRRSGHPISYSIRLAPHASHHNSKRSTPGTGTAMVRSAAQSVPVTAPETPVAERSPLVSAMVSRAVSRETSRQLGGSEHGSSPSASRPGSSSGASRPTSKRIVIRPEPVVIEEKDDERSIENFSVSPRSGQKNLD